MMLRSSGLEASSVENQTFEKIALGKLFTCLVLMCLKHAKPKI